MTKPKDNQPLYHMVKEGLISIIRERGLKPGDLLPTESELEEMFHVSRTTIRTAINELQHEGYIVKQQGRGTFVASNSYAECTALLQSFYEDATQRGNKVTTMLISAELIIPEETVQEMLEIPREEVLKIQRVRYSDGEPIQLSTSYMPRGTYEKFPWREIDFSVTSLYKELEKAGVDLDNGEEIWEVCAADAYQAALLQIPVGAPLFQNCRVVRNKKGETVEYAKAYTRGDRHRTVVQLKRRPDYNSTE